ncbi:Pectinesterase inhibitor [Camellia lanceoleosa]|uniref:Pectinesterase inhibitor n=1 Tax=Camellia lanceoleosa TaxID=1840588 RepID=A0ACC0G0F4_9ERIC|nr:Pectinesterase inhibitor [Camellia lanceoleosa]
MGYSSFSRSFLVSLLLVFILFINISTTRPSMKATDYVSQICLKTQNPSLCLQTLPQSSSGDLKALGQIAINITQTNVKQTSNIIASLFKQATNPKLKGIWVPSNSSSQVSRSISAAEALAFMLLMSTEFIACLAALMSSIAPS